MPTTFGEVAPGIYRLEAALGNRFVTVSVVVGSRGVVIVDTGVASTPAVSLLPALASLGVTAAEDVQAIVVTHADVDHCGGAAPLHDRFPQAPLLCHPKDALMVQDVEVLLERRYRQFRELHDIDLDDEFCKWVRDNGSDGYVETTHLEPGLLGPDGSEPGLEVIHVPGHTEGHVAVFERSSATAIIGDAVLGTSVPDSSGRPAGAPAYRYVASYRNTIETLRSLAPQRMISGHVAVLQGDEISRYLHTSEEFCDRLERAIVERLDHERRPHSVSELLSAVAPAVRTWPSVADPTLVYAVVGHLEDLIVRGQVSVAEQRRRGLSTDSPRLVQAYELA